MWKPWDGFQAQWTIWPKDVANLIGNPDISHSTRKWTIIDNAYWAQYDMQIKAHSFTDINANHRRILQLHRLSIIKAHIKHTDIFLKRLHSGVIQAWTQMTRRISSDWAEVYWAFLWRSGSCLETLPRHAVSNKIIFEKWDQMVTFTADSVAIWWSEIIRSDGFYVIVNSKHHITIRRAMLLTFSVKNQTLSASQQG